MKAFILAAGLGTRLRPLTENITKAAMPVCGVPALWYGAWWLKKNTQIKDFAINSSYKTESLQKAITDSDLINKVGINFYVSDESKCLLGSSGALLPIKEWLGKESLAVLNADSIFTPNWQKLIKVHQKMKGLVTLSLRKFSNTEVAYTNIEIDAFGRVLNFGEKLKSGTMFTGAYIIEPEALNRVPVGSSGLLETLLKPLAQERLLHYYLEEEQEWLDIGSVDLYSKANFNLLKHHNIFRDLVLVKSDIIQNSSVIVPKNTSSLIKAKIIPPFVLNSSDERLVKILTDEKMTLGPNTIILDDAEIPKDVDCIKEKILYNLGTLELGI